MGSSDLVPWYNAPARPFPAQRWVKQQYPFVVWSLAFAWRVVAVRGAEKPRRRFPAQVWAEARWAEV